MPLPVPQLGYNSPLEPGGMLGGSPEINVQT